MIAAINQPEVLCLLMFVFVFGLLFLGFPVAFSLAGTSLLFAFAASALGSFDLSLLNAIGQRFFAIMTNSVLVAVPLFVFMGLMLQRSGIADKLLNTLGACFLRRQGGLAISVTVVGALLAASTGVVGATVVTMGVLSLPAMLKAGYPAPLAAGTVCAAGTLGQIIPPSILLVLLADQLSNAHQQAQFAMGNFAPQALSVSDLFAGALVPGILLVALYIAYIAMLARPTPAGLPDDAPAAPSLHDVLAAVAVPIVLMLLVLGSILAGIASPTEAAAVGAVGAILLTGYKLAGAGRGWVVAGAVASVIALGLAANFDLRLQRSVVPTVELIIIVVAVLCCVASLLAILISLRSTLRAVDDDAASLLFGVCQHTVFITCMVFAIVFGASMFALVFRGIGGDDVVEQVLANVPGGTAGAVLAVMAVIFILGFVLDFLEIVFIIVPVVAPVLLTMDVSPGVTISPVWLGVLIAVNLQTSFLTPPFGFALFYLRGVAPSTVRTVDIYRGIRPFVFIQLLMLLALWFVPELATWLPTLL